MKVNKQTVTTNLIWRFMERIGAQGVSFIVSLFLARLLDPKAYGIIALVTVFTGFLQIFVSCGFGNALVQKKQPDDLDYSSVFYFNLVACIIIYIIIFVTAPLVSIFYNMPELVLVMRVMGLSVIIAGVKNIQESYVSKNLMFKKFFFATLGGTIGASVIGIWMAFMGYGVWALIVQNLFNMTIDTIVLWVTVRWRPKKMFSLKRLKELFSYGWKMLVSGIISTAYGKLTQLIIGKVFSPTDLAFYNKGEAFPSLVVDNINTSIDNVLLPSMSSVQDDKTSLRNMTRRSIKTSTYILMPMMTGLAVCAEPLVSIILTDKWLPCVPFLRIFCFTYAFWPVHTANLNAIKALGHSDIFLKLEILKKVIGLIAILVTVWFGIMPMAYSFLFNSVISQVINSYPNRNLLNYSYIDQLKDMLPAIILTSVMGLLVFSVQFIGLSSWITLIIQIPLGVAIYIIGSKIFKLDSFDYAVSIIKNLLKRNRINKVS